MKLPLLNLTKTEIGKVELPLQFSEEVRSDLIKRAYWTISMNKRQAYGAFPMAGKGYSAYISKRRRAYRGIYGSGSSRTPRKVLTRRGRRLFWVGAFVPNTVGGRRAHPPKAEKIWDKKIPKKENRKAIRSAIASTIVPELIKVRHKIPNNYPFIIDDSITQLKKTKTIFNLLEKLGFKDELERSSVKKVRSGRGKVRGRRYKTKKGVLIVVKDNCDLQKSARNIPGTEVCLVKQLNAEKLAPGGIPGRLTLWTKGAVEALEKEKLFI